MPDIAGYGVPGQPYGAPAAGYGAPMGMACCDNSTLEAYYEHDRHREWA